jgi:O-antigen/teichoic acid export membrane protein
MFKNKIIASIIQASPLTAFSLFFQALRPLVFITIALPTIGSEDFGNYITYIAIFLFIFVFSDLGFGYRFRARGPKDPLSNKTLNLHNKQYSTHLISILLLSLIIFSYYLYTTSLFGAISSVSYLLSQFLFYQIHNLYRYTSEFKMMNIAHIISILAQILLVFVGCELGLIEDSFDLIIYSSLGLMLPCLFFIFYKRRSNWFIFNVKIISFIRKEFKGALDVKTKQVLDIIPLTADRIILNIFLGPVSVSIFYTSMTVSNVISLITKLLGQLTSQHLRISEKKESFDEISSSLKILERSIMFLIFTFIVFIFFLHEIFISLLDILLGMDNIDLTVLFILFLNAFPMMLRGIYNDFCIANEFNRNNRIDSSIYLLSFFGLISMILLSFNNFMIWHVAIAHLTSNILCFIYMRKTITKKLAYFSGGFKK